MLFFHEELVLNLSISLVETFAILSIYTAQLPGWTFKGLFVIVFGINFVLQLIWDVLIYPLCVSPLRHVPSVPVLLPFHPCPPSNAC